MILHFKLNNLVCFYEKQKIPAWKEYKKIGSTSLGKPVSLGGDIIKWIGDILISKSLSNQNLYIYKYLYLIITHSKALHYLPLGFICQFPSTSSRIIETCIHIKMEGANEEMYFSLINLGTKYQCIWKVAISIFGCFLSSSPTSPSPSIKKYNLY